MSKQVIWTTNDSTGKSRQPVQSYQPIWMAHWMRTSSNATADRCGDNASGNKELDHGSRDDCTTLEAPTSVKGPVKIDVNTEYEGICRAQAEHGQDTGDTQAITSIVDHNLRCGKAVRCEGGIQLSSGVLAANEKFSREWEYRSSTEGSSKKSLELVKTHFSSKDRSSTSMPSHERFIGTDIVPYHDLERYNKGKEVVCQSISRPSIVSTNELPDTRLNITGQEDGLKHFQWESRMGNPSKPKTSVNVCHNTSLVLDAPSVHDQSKFGQDWLGKMQKYSHAISLFSSQSSEKNVQKVPRYDPYPLQKFPSRVHETMRICTNVDSVEAPPRGCPWFSQTTHSLLITKNTDISLSKETNIFRRLTTQMNGNSSSDLEYIPPPFFGQANGGVTLQPISSSNSEGQGNIGDTGIGTSNYASKNESSAETDTMDMDFAKEERPIFGENSTCSTKVFSFNNNPSPRINVASSRETGGRWMSSGLHEINLELPALPAVASSSEDAPTSSRTQSLEMDILLAQAEQPEPKSNPSPHNSPRADPTTRWVKRLRLSSSDSSRGTKSLKLTEKSSHDKRRQYFRSILEKGIPREQQGEETFFPKEAKEASPDQPKKSKELLLSHVWIKRWLRNESQISQRKPETVVVCEPQCLKPDDDLQKKQFPSIAAMAMMGRSMTGFQSCELQKRGPFTIWNTSTF